MKSAQPGTLAASFHDTLATVAQQHQVVEARLGLGYMAVVLNNGAVGLAYTFRHETNASCTAFEGLDGIAGCSALRLLGMLGSADRLEAGLGLATVNALTQHEPREELCGDIVELLDLRASDHVGMVGHFAPVALRLAERVKELTVFERIDAPTATMRPAAEAAATLPHCDIALITATTLINHSIDELLSAAQHCREVVILGASTPLSPLLFAGTPVTMLSGVQVRDTAALLRVISEGGGMRRFSRHVAKLGVRLSA